MNLTHQLLIYKISETNFKEFTMKELAEKINTNRYNPNFCEIFKFLIEQQAINKIKTVGSTNLYAINYKTLDYLFKQTKIYEMISNWMHSRGIVVVTP